MPVHDQPRLRPDPPIERKRIYRGALLGGAVGDALGAPVEFMSLADIRELFGGPGITEFTTAFGRKGAITDDTQMTLFTAEGLLRAHVAGAAKGGIPAISAIVSKAYARWLLTQQGQPGLSDVERDGWLFDVAELHAQRVPAAACLSALERMARPGMRATNDSRSAGGVMRVAPIGLWCARMDEVLSTDRAVRRAFELGADVAGLTHGHPSARIAAGTMAALMLLLARAMPLRDALAQATSLLARYPGHVDTLSAIRRAEALASREPLRADSIIELGEGWFAEEALAIAIACALAAPDYETGVRLAVNHDGDSDSTASIAGSLLGAMHGVEGIPKRWLLGLEMRRVVIEVADDLATFIEWPVGEFMPGGDQADYWLRRYPPS